MMQSLWQAVEKFLKKVNIELPFTKLYKNSYTNINSIIHNSQKIKAI